MSLFKHIRMPRTAMSIETWAKRCSTITTPERIISAAVAESLAKDFDDWTSTGCFEKHHHYSSSNQPAKARLTNSEKGVLVIFGQRTRLRMTTDGYDTSPRLKGTTVNGIEISPDDALIIWNAHEKIKRRMDALRAAEQKALSSMKKNEKAWDLVEKLLGMKRNEFGALVPVKTVEE